MTPTEKHRETAEQCLEGMSVAYKGTGGLRVAEERIVSALSTTEREAREDERRRAAKIAERWTPFPEPTSRAARYWLKHVARPAIAAAILSGAGEGV